MACHFSIKSALLPQVYCWWRFRITRDYREKLRQAELKALQNELIEKDNRIRELEENNDSLAKIIHKDNKLIPAMELAVCEYLEMMNKLFRQPGSVF